MNPSIRRRLLIALLSMTFVVWMVIALTSYLDIRYEVEQLFDAQLAQSARVLLAFNSIAITDKQPNTSELLNTRELPALSERLFGHKYEKKLAFQIWQNQKVLALKSANAPPFVLSDKEYGYSDRMVYDQQWRVFSLPDDNGPRVALVGEQIDIREELIQSIVRRTLLPFLLAFPILALLIWFSIGRAMAPLERLAKQVSDRAATFLQPVEAAGVPKEAKPLVDSLNNLFERLDMAFERERRFTSDASHELRTPLAGLKIQTQVALNSNNKQNRTKALGLIMEGVDRATHLVQQLLTLARLDPDVGYESVSDVDLCGIAVQVSSDLAPAAYNKNIDLSILDNCNGIVKGSADSLAILLRNLIDNAIRYTPKGGIIEISVTRSEESVILSVVDNGPGIPAEDRENVFKRFYRRLGTQATGSGLGLSIVRRIAELHHANITIAKSCYDGLQIKIGFLAQDLTQ